LPFASPINSNATLTFPPLAGYGVIEWIEQHGYVKMVAGAYMAILLFVNLIVLVFMAYGKRIRVFMHHSWVGQLHQRAAKEY
jgi:Zn-dependent protease